MNKKPTCLLTIKEVRGDSMQEAGQNTLEDNMQNLLKRDLIKLNFYKQLKIYGSIEPDLLRSSEFISTKYIRKQNDWTERIINFRTLGWMIKVKPK